jgi:hypothetical protein
MLLIGAVELKQELVDYTNMLPAAEEGPQHKGMRLGPFPAFATIYLNASIIESETGNFYFVWLAHYLLILPSKSCGDWWSIAVRNCSAIVTTSF